MAGTADAVGTDVVIVGGCGRVGLPLGLALASRGLSVVLYDVNAEAVEQVNAARMPFAEPGADQVLPRVARAGLLRASTAAVCVAGAEHVIVVVGTPVDEHLNPDLGAVPRALERCGDQLRDGQLIVLRSTVHPGVTALTERQLAARGLAVDVAFCPERIAEGRALAASSGRPDQPNGELFDLPQIVAARTDRAGERAEKLFRHLTEQVVRVCPEEAELAKLFTNTWRYVKFATANQFWMMANDAGLDFARIHHAITFDYPRAADVPMPGFAAGPCLLKDTMQLAAFNKNNFVLGHSAMLINEGLPLYLVSRLEARFDLPSLTVGILGMAFKGGSDDPRESLAYKLRKILLLKADQVWCTDPYVTDQRLAPLEQVLERAHVLIIAAPHRDYAQLATQVSPDVPVIDMWGLTGQGVRI